MPPSIRSLAVSACLVALAGCDLGRGGVTPPVTGASPGVTGALGAVSGVAKYEAVDTPHSGITVRLTAPGFQAETTTDEKGRYAFQNLNPGAYELRFERSRYYPATQSIGVDTATASVPTTTLSNHRLLYASADLYDLPHMASLTSLTLAPGGNGLAFVERGVLKTLPFEGGTPTVVRDLQPPAGTVVDSFDWTSAGLIYSRVEGGATASLYLTAGSDPTGPLQVATSSARLLLCPVLSPDGAEFAYLTHVAEPWTLENADGSTAATGDFRLAVVKQAKSAATGTRVGLYPINGQWNFGFGPLQWTTAGILFHKPMFCDIYRNNPSDGPVGDGIFLLSPGDGALTKLYYYSDYEHCLSADGRLVYFHEGRRVYGRRVDDPLPYNQGQFILGYDRTGMVGNMIPGPGGDRLYYVSARGLEEMTLLPQANE